jgi:hypothetical protein
VGTSLHYLSNSEIDCFDGSVVLKSWRLSYLHEKPLFAPIYRAILEKSEGIWILNLFEGRTAIFEMIEKLKYGKRKSNQV